MLHWALTVVGLTTIITQSSLFAPLRQGFQWLTGSKFLGCPMCVGFWVGFGLSAWKGESVLSMVIDGLASSGICWIVYVALVKLGCREL